MTKSTYLLVSLAFIAIGHPVAANPVPQEDHSARLSTGIDIPDGESDIDNKIFSYKPLLNEVVVKKSHQTNKIHLAKPLDLERDSADKKVAASSVAAGLSDSDLDRIRQIAFNSQEVRLLGPERKPIKMKDDLPTKMLVAWDNLQKEASEVWTDMNDKLDQGITELKKSQVWSQMNDKLDKGWTDFKSILESVVPQSAKTNPKKDP